MDTDEIVSLQDFDAICIRYGVSLSSEDLTKIRSLFCDESSDLLNFRQLSYHFGLHKESYNHINGVLNSSRGVSRSINRLKSSLIAGSQRIEEEIEDAKEDDTATLQTIAEVHRRVIARRKSAMVKSPIREITSAGPRRQRR